MPKPLAAKRGSMPVHHRQAPHKQQRSSLRKVILVVTVGFVAIYFVFVGTSFRSIHRKNQAHKRGHHYHHNNHDPNHNLPTKLQIVAPQTNDISNSVQRGNTLQRRATTFHHHHHRNPPTVLHGEENDDDKATTTQQQQQQQQQCPFRHYPPRRYYGLNEVSKPDFLQDAEYIYGQEPMLLRPAFPGAKLCVNQSEWLGDDESTQKTLPFADGTNPSILSLERLQDLMVYKQLQQMGGHYVATICMTNSQCAWNDSPQEMEEYRLSALTKPSTVRTVLLVLDRNWNAILETTLFLVRNAPWGRRTPPQQEPDGTYTKAIRAFDDARLFVHKSQLWVSYREGPGFGYDKQVINPIHFELGDDNDTKTFGATVKASETAQFCCGRNMALMQNHDTGDLQSLTWVDPITVIDVDDGSTTTKEQESGRRRRLQGSNGGRAKKRRKSHVHGTNAFMVEFNDGKELLGIAHFHRPPDRDKNDYARFGHHYTHAFFTIPRNPPFRLSRLSPEFVLPSNQPQHADDAEIIQFLSGLEVAEETAAGGKNVVIVAYGINDCEGAVVELDTDQVEELLQDVPEGKQVVDLMKPRLA